MHWSLASTAVIFSCLRSSGKHRMSCVSILGQDQRESIERNMKDTVDEMISAFDRHLEDSAASAKQQFRWMKRRYREKIDVNRAASRIELKVGATLKNLIRSMLSKSPDAPETAKATSSDDSYLCTVRSVMFPSLRLSLRHQKQRHGTPPLEEAECAQNNLGKGHVFAQRHIGLADIRLPFGIQMNFNNLFRNTQTKYRRTPPSEGRHDRDAHPCTSCFAQSPWPPLLPLPLTPLLVPRVVCLPTNKTERTRFFWTGASSRTKQRRLMTGTRKSLPVYK